MYRPPLRGRPALADKKVLLIDSCQATREVRAAVLRSHGVAVHAAEGISAARSLWQPRIYDLAMLDVRRYSPGETLEFYEQIKQASPHEQVVFLVGPQPIFRLLGPVKSWRKMAHPDSGSDRQTLPRCLTVFLRPQRSIRLVEAPCRESRLWSTRSRLNGVKGTDTDIW